MLNDLIRRSRSFRRFYGNRPITHETLLELVDLARLSPSTANLQPLKFILSPDENRNALIFKNLRWAGYLADWPGPVENERPTAYIVILGDNEIAAKVKWDDAIAAHSIIMGAVEKALGGCILASIDKDALREDLRIPARYEILLIVALGYPIEEVVIDEIAEGGDIKYFRDNNGVHHVPKRRLDDIVLEI